MSDRHTTNKNSPLIASASSAALIVTIVVAPAELEGRMVQVEYLDGSTKQAEPTQTPHTVSAIISSDSTHFISTKATCDFGATGLSATVTVTAQATPTQNVTPDPPTFNTVYNPNDSFSTATYNGAPGTQLLLNLPLSTNSDPNPATMLIFAPNGTQVGQFDFSGFDVGVQFGFVLNGTTYISTLINGDRTLS